MKWTMAEINLEATTYLCCTHRHIGLHFELCLAMSDASREIKLDVAFCNRLSMKMGPVLPQPY
jgi:hypothetical protein